MLRHLGAGARCDQRGAGRHIVGAGAVAAGADDIDRTGSHVHALHARAHHLRSARDFLHGLAAHAQRHQESAHLRAGGGAFGHQVECRADFTFSQCGAAGYLLDQLAQFLRRLGIHVRGAQAAWRAGLVLRRRGLSPATSRKLASNA
jgi:hypothetical protein